MNKIDTTFVSSRRTLIQRKLSLRRRRNLTPDFPDQFEEFVYLFGMPEVFVRQRKHWRLRAGDWNGAVRQALRIDNNLCHFFQFSPDSAEKPISLTLGQSFEVEFNRLASHKPCLAFSRPLSEPTATLPRYT